MILTKQFNFFARFTHERSPDGERTRTTDGRGRTEAGAGCTPAARLSDRKSNISYSAISWGIYIRFRPRSLASDRDRPPSSNDIDGLLCFHPTTTSSPLFLRRRPTNVLPPSIPQSDSLDGQPSCFDGSCMQETRTVFILGRSRMICRRARSRVALPPIEQQAMNFI